MDGFRLGSISGFEIRIDFSWFVIVFLILWSFSAGVFPQRFPGLATGTYLAMGTAGAVLFFTSLLAHELSHSVVARSRGIPVAGITLFIFGGLARTGAEASTPEDELVIAGVGPLCSVALGFLFHVLHQVGVVAGWPLPVTGVARYLGFLNFVLAGFNLLPGFPLDGGRLFRALAWKATGDLTRATRWASDGGRILGYTLVTLGVIQVLGGLVVGGLWLVFIGWFLRTAAVFSFQQHVLRGVLRGVEARRVMTPHPTTVSPGLSLEDLVEERFLRDPYQSYPVLDRYGVVGLVTLDQVKSTPRDRWAHTRVGDVMTTPPGLLVSPESSLVDILERMAETKSNRVMVMADGKLVGVISPSDVSRWIQREQMIADLKERPR